MDEMNDRVEDDGDDEEDAEGEDELDGGEDNYEEKEDGDADDLLDLVDNEDDDDVEEESPEEPIPTPIKTPPRQPLKLKFKVSIPSASSSNTTLPIPSQPSTRGPGRGKRKAAAVAMDKLGEEEDELMDQLMEEEDRKVRGGGGGGGGDGVVGVRTGKKRGRKKKVVIAENAPSDSESFDSADFEREYNVPHDSDLDPLKMTARQRAKHRVDGNGEVEELFELGRDRLGKMKDELTEVERARRKEEIARKRKLQLDQKQEEEKTDTINRLLRAQSGRTKTKLSTTSRPTSGAPSASPPSDIPRTLLRYISSIKSGELAMSVSFPQTKVDGLGFERKVGKGKLDGMCDVCSVEKRIYRSLRDREKGACGVEHLKVLDEGVK